MTPEETRYLRDAHYQQELWEKTPLQPVILSLLAQELIREDPKRERKRMKMKCFILTPKGLAAVYTQ